MDWKKYLIKSYEIYKEVVKLTLKFLGKYGAMNKEWL